MATVYVFKLRKMASNHPPHPGMTLQPQQGTRYCLNIM